MAKTKTLLAEMTWEEAEEALKKCEVVVIPTGSVEQHGPGLPLGTDMMVADALGKALANKVGENIIVLPVSPFGYCDYHSDFAGTLSLKEETLIAVISDLLDYVLRWGVKRVLFLNSHGANCGALKNISHKLRQKNILTATAMWWDVAVAVNPEWGLIGHGDINETSFIMSLRPDLVHMDRLKNAQPSYLTPSMRVKNLYAIEYKDANIQMGLRTRDCTDFGCMLEVGFEGSKEVDMADVNLASAQRGTDMIDGVTTLLTEFLEDFKKLELYDVNFPDEPFYSRK